MTYTIKPGEHELREARQLVETTLSTAEAVLEKDAAYEAGLSWNTRFEPVVYGPEELGIGFNSRPDGWKQRVKQVAAQAYAKAWFLEHVEPELHWQEVLMLGHSLLFSEQITGEKPELNDRAEIQEHWKELKQQLSRPVDDLNPEIAKYGFSTAYYIAEKLAESHELGEFTGLNRSDVEAAGEAVFGRTI